MIAFPHVCHSAIFRNSVRKELGRCLDTAEQPKRLDRRELDDMERDRARRAGRGDDLGPIEIPYDRKEEL